MSFAFLLRTLHDESTIRIPWEDEHGIAQGHYVNGTIYISGQFSHDMQGTFVGEDDIEARTRLTFENLDRVLTGFATRRTSLR